MEPASPWADAYYLPEAENTVHVVWRGKALQSGFYVKLSQGSFTATFACWSCDKKEEFLTQTWRKTMKESPSE